MEEVRGRTPLVWGVAACLLMAGIVHFALAPSHLGESTVEGWGFLLAGWAQLGLAAWLLLRPSRAVWVATVVVNFAVLAVWGWSRTKGLPFGAHANTVEAIGTVDGVAAALEGVALVAALVGVRQPTMGVGSPERSSSLRFASVGAVVVPVVVGMFAVTSPSAVNHAHSGGAEAPGLAELTNGHQHDHVVTPLTDAEHVELVKSLAPTQELMKKYPTVAAAEAAGYQRAGPFGPGVGTHYTPPTDKMVVDADGVIDGDDLKGALLIYDGSDPDSPLAGFMMLSGAESKSIKGFPGTQDNWHYHRDVCLVKAADGHLDSPFGADTGNVPKSACDKLDGTLMAQTPSMVHIWNVPGYENPLGLFGEINSALPCDDGTFYRMPLAEIGTVTDSCDPKR